MQKNVKEKTWLSNIPVYILPVVLPIAAFVAAFFLKLNQYIVAPTCFASGVALYIGLNWWFQRSSNSKVPAGGNDPNSSSVDNAAISHQLAHFLKMMKFPPGSDIRCTIWLPIEGGAKLKQILAYLPDNVIGKDRVRESFKGIIGDAYHGGKCLSEVLVGDHYNDPIEFRKYAQEKWKFTEAEAHALDGTRRAYLAVPVMNENGSGVLAVIYCDSNRTETFSDEAAVRKLAEDLVPFFCYLLKQKGV